MIAGCSGGGTPERADARSVDADTDAAPNLPPVAVAGRDRTVGHGTRLSLDGRDSSDPEREPLGFSWFVASAPAASTATLENPQTATPAIELQVAGIYVFVLTVHDGVHASPPDAVVIRVVDGVPVANAGPDQSVPHGSQVVLDGTGSFDAETEALWYSWAMSERPPGSAAELDDANAASPKFTADLVGQYEVRLFVFDGMSSSAFDHVVVTATNAAPVVSAGSDRIVMLGAAVPLVGTATDLEGDPLAITWELTAKPAGSTAAPTPSSALTSAIVIDTPGVYRLTLTVSDGFTSAGDEVVLGTAPDAVVLTHDVLDAEYSRTLDRLVMISDDPGDLWILDPATGAEITVDLQTPPLSVSVAPNGLQAVVGLADGRVSVVDLVAAEVISTWLISVAASDIIHGGNGYAYVIPEVGSFTSMHSVALPTGTDVPNGGPIWNRSSGRRHPTQSAIYAADRVGVSPARIRKYSIASGISSFVAASNVVSQNLVCGDVWFGEEGARIFTACGNIFHASADPGLDMTLAASLTDTDRVTYLDHSAAAQLVAAIPANPPFQVGHDTRIDVYDDVSLAFAQSIELTAFVLDEWVAARGQFVFFSHDGTALYVVMKAVPSAGLPRTMVWRAR